MTALIFQGLRFCHFKLCVSGICTEDFTAPIGDCIYGDDLASANNLNQVVSFPTQYTTCANAIQALIAKDIDPVYWCSSSLFSFRTTCCKTCSSKYSNILKTLLIPSNKKTLVQVFNATSCVDKAWYCHIRAYSRLCGRGLSIGGTKIEDLCPYTCKKCQRRSNN